MPLISAPGGNLQRHFIARNKRSRLIVVDLGLDSGTEQGYKYLLKIYGRLQEKLVTKLRS